MREREGGRCVSGSESFVRITNLYEEEFVREMNEKKGKGAFFPICSIPSSGNNLFQASSTRVLWIKEKKLCFFLC